MLKVATVIACVLAFKTQEVALDASKEKDTSLPIVTELVFEENETVGGAGTGPTVIVAVFSAVPPVPVQEMA